MQSQTDDINSEIINGINHCKTIVFCGAGISRDSGLPIVSQFIPYILEKLEVPEEDKKLILDKDYSPKIPFEAFIEGIQVGHNLDSILDVYDQGEPNTNHILLAKLIKSGKLNTIVTTNFDNLIENALSMEPNAMSEGEDYDIIYKTQSYENINWDDGRIRIIKIHGSVSDREDMAITVKQIASRVLSNARNKIIEYVFSKGNHTNVLILGYSSSDIFDLSPQIEAIRSNYKKVYYIQHSDYPKVETIQEQRDRNPFKNFVGSLRMHYNTRQLMKRIWDTCLDSNEIYKLKTSTIKWKANVDEWFSQALRERTRGVIYKIPAYIFTEMGLSRTALRYYEQILRIEIELGDKENEGLCLGDMSMAFLEIGEYSKSIIHSEKAIKLAQQFGNRQEEGMWIGNLGIAYSKLGEIDLSTECFIKAMKIAENVKDIRSIGRYLGILGNNFRDKGEFEESIRYYEKAMDVAQKIGDKKHEAYWNCSIGGIDLRLGDYCRAIKYIKAGQNISEAIGDKDNLGLSYSNLGVAYLFLKKDEKAIKCFELALEISREIGNKEEEKIRLYNLGRYYLSKGEHIKANKYYEEADTIISSDIPD